MLQTRFEQIARIAAVALLVVGCFLILQPFMGAILIAGVICFASWQVFVQLRDRLGGRSGLAAIIVVTILILALAVRVALVAQSIVVPSAEAVEAFRGFLDRKATFELPAFIREIPAVGPWLDSYVRNLMQSSADLIAFAKSFSEPAKGFFTAMGKAAVQGFIQILIAIFVAYFFYRDGDRIRRLLLDGMVRIDGAEHGITLEATAQAT